MKFESPELIASWLAKTTLEMLQLWDQTVATPSTRQNHFSDANEGHF